MITGEITPISYQEAKDFLLPRHYSGRVPSISKAFGWRERERDELKAVITFGKPSSPSLCKGICGVEWSNNVYELNRLCRTDDFKQPLSHLVSYALKRLKDENWIIVSYSDTAMHHNGYIYQACNFLYTGQTKARTDIYTGEGKHSRHYGENDMNCGIRVLRSAKNRYVYFCSHDKKLKRQWLKDLKYPVMPYPKEQNQNYVLGEYIKPTLITNTNKKYNGKRNQMRIVIYDCEVFAHNWLVTFKDKETDTYTCIWDDNEELIECLDNECIYIGFNSKHYDQYIIKAIVGGFTPEEIKQLNDFLISGGQGWQYPGLDFYFDFNNVDIRDDTQQGLSLKAIEGHLGLSIKESSVPFDLDRPLTAEEKQETQFYCSHDVDTTEKLVDLRKDYLKNKINLGKLAGINQVKAMGMTNAKLTAAMLQAQPQQHNDERQYKYPDNLLKEYIPQEVFNFFNRMYDESISDEDLFSGKLELMIGECAVKLGYGGIHGYIPNYFWKETEERGIWNEDVGSYYPHLCTINGYTSRNIPSPKIYEDILERRMKAKAEGDKQTANALKLVCNTTYGCLLNQYNALYDPLMGRSVCISGQLYLLELAEHCYQEIKDLHIVQLNTDGMMVECAKASYEQLKAICTEWQQRTGFELEEDTVIQIAQKDVNNYIEVQSTGEIKSKGGYLVKGIAPAGAFNVNNSCVIVATALKEYLINGITAEETINNCNDITQFQIIAKAGSKYKEAYHLVDGKKQPVQKVNRVYATSDERYGKIYKIKAENDSEAKIESLPEHCIIDNDNKLTIVDIDKTFYIEMAKKRINDFMGVKPEKINKKSKKEATKMATTAKASTNGMNVYQKLIEARERFLMSNVNQTGKNMKLSFKYFELSDIVPTITHIFKELGLISVVQFLENNIATLSIINTDKPEEYVLFQAPFTSIQPIVSREGKQVTNDMQALGSSITYMRRYLYLIAMDICVNDEIEPTIDGTTNNQSVTPVAEKKAPVTPEQRKEVKENLTAPTENADTLQIKGLKTVLKKLKEADPSKEELIANIAVQTNGFTTISKADCEKLVQKITAMLEEGGKA